MKLSDYVARYLADHGVRHVFMLTGGGAMHLNDSFGQEKRIQCVCCHHEQACAMAAEGYSRTSGKLGVVNVTTGPGGINALNGVFGAWTDSIPMLVISGQVKRETCLENYRLPGLRQLGDQEADIIPMVRGITKYAAYVDDPLTIRYHLDRACRLATSGRPGPVWLDIPVDVQAFKLDETKLQEDDAESEPTPDRASLATVCQDIISRIGKARSPVLMVGTGIRCARAEQALERVMRRLAIPVVTAWTHDLLASDDPLFCGRPGTIGDRAGNFTVQNSDFLLTIGSRLNIRQVSYSWKSFAPRAFKVQVDMDPAELSKPTVRPDLPVLSDARLFLEELERQLEQSGYDGSGHARWLAWCRERRERYPVVQPRQRQFNGRVNPYHFVEVLFQHLADDDVIVCGNASACIVPFQVAAIKKGQRMFSNSGAASMGHALPAAIGAAFARDGKRVICLDGDGSIQLNIQELQTIAHHRLPVKIFVMNNGCYLSIRQTESTFFGRLTGESPSSGVSFPDYVDVAQAYGLNAMQLDTPEFPAGIRAALEQPGPVLCDVALDSEQMFEPRTKSRELPDGSIISPPLEDMFPFLPPEELESNRYIPPA